MPGLWENRLKSLCAHTQSASTPELSTLLNIFALRHFIDGAHANLNGQQLIVCTPAFRIFKVPMIGGTSRRCGNLQRLTCFCM